jgi:choline dehydrogenase-like flavoprotein
MAGISNNNATAPVITDYQDKSAVPDDIQTDLCIIGAGAAGIAIAHSLVGTPINICVLESGGWKGEETHQSLNDGHSAGVAPFELRDSRLRAFGGSCNVWGGGCIPLAPSTFSARPWVPHSGWPITPDEIEPYYAAARSFCGIHAHDFVDGSCTSEPAHELPAFDSEELDQRRFAISPYVFGDTYRRALAEASNVTVLLHASALQLELDATGRLVRRVRLGTLGGRRGTVAARQFVIASGGLENARLLLLSKLDSGAAPGNAYGLVGRFLMDHPSCTLGHLSGVSDDWHRPYFRVNGRRGLVLPEIVLSDTGASRRRILGARVRAFDVENDVPNGLQAIRQLRSVIRKKNKTEETSIESRVQDAMHGARPRAERTQASLRHLPTLAGRTLLGLGDITGAVMRRASGKPAVRTESMRLVGYFEQAPNYHSRLSLNGSFDAFGQRQAHIDWQLTSLDYQTYRTCADIFGHAMVRALGGRFELAPWLEDPAAHGAAEIVGTSHHMGTTRMGRDPQSGVVDPNCQVYGTKNLHIAGSSVFPAAGWEFPTFTIVALGLRLSSRLKSLLETQALTCV